MQRQRADLARRRGRLAPSRPPRPSARRARRTARRGTSCRRPCGRRGRARRRPSRRPARPRTRPAPCRRRGSRPSPRGRRASRTSCARRCGCGSSSPRDDPAGRHPVLVLARRQVGERAVDRLAQRLAHLLQRMRGDEQADRLLLDRQQLGLLELDVGIGGCAARRTPPPRRCRSTPPPKSSESKIEPWPISRSCWAFCPAPCACSSTISMPLRVAPVEPNAPHLISASIDFLFTVRQSTRAQKSHSELERAALLARGLDRLDGRVADALDGIQAEADVAVRRRRSRGRRR